MSEKTLYFGYGSNLDHEDWSGWCEDRDLDPSGLVELGPAWLPDFEMRFHYYSDGREGGAADVVYAGPGHAVPGALFEMDEKAHKAMDRKEGHPDYYERRDVNVILADGSIVKALTYTVVDEKILDYHEPPTEEYANLISNGLQRLGLPTHFLDAAVNDSSAGVDLSDIFVYGTLMQDQSRNAALNSHPHELLGLGSVVGGLVDLGDFPGLTNKESMVHGELYTVGDISRLISDLDRIEGFYGYGQQNSLFTRMIIEVECGGSKHWAWTYIYNGEDGTEISSGDWRNRNH